MDSKTLDAATVSRNLTKLTAGSSNFSVRTVAGQGIRYQIRCDLFFGFPYKDSNIVGTKRVGMTGTKGIYCVSDGNAHSVNAVNINKCTS